MTGTKRASGLCGKFRAYARLLTAVGHEVECKSVAEHLAAGQEQSEDLERLLARAVAGKRAAGDAPGGALERMDELSGALAREFVRAAPDLGEADLSGLLRAVEAMPRAEKERLADALVLNGHTRFVRPRYCRLAEVREAMAEREDGGQMVLVKLVPFLRRELERRGFQETSARIRQWLGDAPGDEEVPYCLKRILRDVNGGFKTGLISLEELMGDSDADEWLESAREKLQFRSHSAMHKAVAEATSLKYDCVHKALSGRRKAKRIQAEIKHCFDVWLEDAAEGRAPEINPDYRGVTVERMHRLLPALEQKYRTKEEIYRVISRHTGIKTGSVRRYFQNNGQLKYAPLDVYRCANALATEPRPREARPRSYLEDGQTRQVAGELARQAREALGRWQCLSEDPELEVAFKELRRALIVAIKEQRHMAPVLT